MCRLTQPAVDPTGIDDQFDQVFVEIPTQSAAKYTNDIPVGEILSMPMQPHLTRLYFVQRAGGTPFELDTGNATG